MADALSKPDPTLWRLRPRAPMPGTVLCPLEGIPDGDAKEFVFGRGTTVFSMFVVRRGDKVYGYLNICPHYSSALNARAGQFLSDDKSHIRCTAHFAEFRIEDGYGVRGAAERCWLDPVPVHVENGAIVISTLAEPGMSELDVDHLPERPDTEISVRETFAVDIDAMTPAYSQRTPHVPVIDRGYRFDPGTTMAILSGFAGNRRVVIQGRHGTGKSTHIEQVAARLNWPCVRVNLDSHISRIDLIGKDAIVLRDGKQVTEYREGILPWAYQRPVALVFDEYDAGRPDVMFVIQRVLEAEGRLTILDQNKVLLPHPSFRIFATANTIGLGDSSGLYHGTQQLNQAQLDRWNIVARLDYLPEDEEVDVVLSKVPDMADAAGRAVILQMVRTAEQTRIGFQAGDVSTLMSPRTVISWADNFRLFGDLDYAFETAFLNRCDEAERPVVAEYYQRATGRTLEMNARGPWKRVEG